MRNSTTHAGVTCRLLNIYEDKTRKPVTTALPKRWSSLSFSSELAHSAIKSFVKHPWAWSTQAIRGRSAFHNPNVDNKRTPTHLHDQIMAVCSAALGMGPVCFGEPCVPLVTYPDMDETQLNREMEPDSAIQLLLVPCSMDAIKRNQSQLA